MRPSQKPVALTTHSVTELSLGGMSGEALTSLEDKYGNAGPKDERPPGLEDFIKPRLEPNVVSCETQSEVSPGRCPPGLLMGEENPKLMEKIDRMDEKIDLLSIVVADIQAKVATRANGRNMMGKVMTPPTAEEAHYPIFTPPGNMCH